MNNKKFFRPILIIVAFSFFYQNLAWAYPCQFSCLRALSFLQRGKPKSAASEWNIVASGAKNETKTKITYTVRFGENPSEDTIKALIDNGVTRFWFDVAQVRTKTDAQLINGRINRIRKIAKEKRIVVTIVADMGGRQIRVGKTPKSKKVFELTKGQTVFVGTDETDLIKIGLGNFIHVDDPRLIKNAKAGDTIIINEGEIVLKVMEPKKDNKLTCRVEKEGQIQEGLDVYAPDTDNMSPSCLTGAGSDTYISWFITPDGSGPDMIALAVQSKEDVETIQRKVKAASKKGTPIPIIAELSTRAAIKHSDEILAAGASAIAINRQKLYQMMGPDEFSRAQDNIIAYAIVKETPVIVTMDMGEHIAVGKSIPDWSESLNILTSRRVDSINFRLGTKLDEDPLPSMETLVSTVRSNEETVSMLTLRSQQGPQEIKRSSLPRDLVLKLGYVAACDPDTNIVAILTRSGRNLRELLKMSAMGGPMTAKICAITPTTAPASTIHLSNFRRETIAILVENEPTNYGKFGEYISWLAKILPEEFGVKIKDEKVTGNVVIVYGPSARDSDTLTIIDLKTGREISAPIHIASNIDTANLPQRNTASSI